MTHIDVAGQKVTLFLVDIKGLSEFVRKNMSLANEKEHSVGVGCESISSSCRSLLENFVSTNLSGNRELCGSIFPLNATNCFITTAS
jgi:hypothetical protein